MPTAARPRVVAGLRLLAAVGHGAEGEVWEARDTRGRRRALKLIRPDALVEPDEVRRRGAWLTAVDHPALVRVWRTGVLRGGGLDGWGFVEMSFVDGPSLQRAPAMPDAFDRLERLAEGLDLLHAGAWSHGVALVHRDVKPANIVDAVDGGLVLVDHSTLRVAGPETVTRIGTPVFAAPEVVTGRLGPPADVYSFCATAVALHTGARGEALADLLAGADWLDVPEGVRAGLRPLPADRPWSCLAALGLDSEGPQPTVVLPPAAAVPAPTPAGGPGPRPAGGWLVALAAIVLAPAVAAVVRPPWWPDTQVLLAGAAVAHVACHLLHGGHRLAALLAPPLAWALVLSERVTAPGRRRDWALPLVLGGMIVVTVAVLASLRVLAADVAGGRVARLVAGVPGAGLEPAGVLAATCAALLLLAACVRAARRGGPGLRVLLLPLWALGAVALLAGGLALLLPAALAGRGAALLRLLGRTVVGVVAVVRPERRAAGPDAQWPLPGLP